MSIDEETQAFIDALFAPKPSQAALIQALHPQEDPEPDPGQPARPRRGLTGWPA